MRPTAQQYSAVAIVLHWAIATAILGNILLGWWMHEAIDIAASRARAVEVFQLHKSIGLSVLVLSLLRLAWRLTHRPPPMPAHMKPWEKLAATATHWSFYVLMIAMPLSGWLYVSTQWRGDIALNVPTLWFGWLEVPHLLGLHHADEALRQSLAGIVLEAHELLAWGTCLLLLMHVGAALKHHFVNRDEVLSHMVPIAARQSLADQPAVRKWILRAGMALIAIAVAATAYAVLGPAKKTAVALSDTDGITMLSDDWMIDPLQSEIVFSGTHAGTPFEGRFQRWQAQLNVDPQAPEAADIITLIDTASGSDGNVLHDRTLPQTEWFNVAQYPQAHFVSTQVQRLDEQGRYAVAGTLTIKDRDIPVNSLQMQVSQSSLLIEGDTVITREQADLGMASDPGGDWVSSEIKVRVRLSATRNN